MPNKLLGQHFLRNATVIKKIIDAIDVRTNEVIWEIGPGNGELTFPLLNICRARSAKLVAIEKDVQLVEGLTQGIPDDAGDFFEIISGDALKVFKSHIEFPSESWKIVGNIPYYITGHLFRVIGELPILPGRCVFLIQKEVAERLAAGPGTMNRLAASVQFWAEPRIACRVSRGDFSPAPKVDSAVIALQKKNGFDPEEKDQYFKAVRMIFVQPRKTLLNNIDNNGKNRNSKEIVLQKLARLDINPNIRPQDLSIQQIKEIAKTFF